MLSKLRGALRRKRTPQTFPALIEFDPQHDGEEKATMLSRLRGALSRKGLRREEPEVEWSRTPAADARPQDLPEFVCVGPHKKLAAALRAQTLEVEHGAGPLEVGLYSLEQAETPAFKKAFRIRQDPGEVPRRFGLVALGRQHLHGQPNDVGCNKPFLQGVLYRQHMDKRMATFFPVSRFDGVMESMRRAELMSFAHLSYSRVFAYDGDAELREHFTQVTFWDPKPGDVMPDFGDLSEWFWVRYVLRGQRPWLIAQEILSGEQYLTFGSHTVPSIGSDNAHVSAILAKCGVEIEGLRLPGKSDRSVFQALYPKVHISIARHERAVYEAMPKQVDLTRTAHREDASRAFREVAVQRWRNFSILPHVRSDLRRAGLAAVPRSEAAQHIRPDGKRETELQIPIVLYGDEGARKAPVRSTWITCFDQAKLEGVGPGCRDPFRYPSSLPRKVWSAAFEPTETADTGRLMRAAQLDSYDCAPAAFLDRQANGTRAHFGTKVLVINATDADAQLTAGGDGSAWRALLLPEPEPVPAAEATGAGTVCAPLLPAPVPAAEASHGEAAASGHGEAAASGHAEAAASGHAEAAASGHAEAAAAPVVACILGNINDLDDARVLELQQWLGATLRMAPSRVIPMRTFTFASAELRGRATFPERDVGKHAREREKTCLSALKALERLLRFIHDDEAAAIAQFRSELSEQGVASRWVAALASTICPYISDVFAT